MNKKGIFFTLTALLLISLFLIGYSAYYIKDTSSKKRIETLNSFLFSTEQDLSRQLYISSFRMIFIMEDKITKTGQYVTDLNSTISEGFFNGTMFGEQQELLVYATFPEIESTLQERAAKINANVTLDNANLQFIQEDPWHVKAVLNVHLVLTDLNNIVKWDRTEAVNASISVQDFEDPIYIVNTQGILTNQIIKTPYTNFVVNNSVSNLLNHSLSSYYTNSTQAPDFLSRLQGQTSPSPYGIESLVNLNKLSSSGISVQDKSVVDYIYFSSSNPTTSYHVHGMPSWFKIDQEHLDTYQVSSLIY